MTTPSGAALPRGIRNHNPGNIRHGADWQGLSATQTDAAFCQFTEPVWGIRALCRVLINYGAKYGLRSVRGIITRWAPPNENDTPAYVGSVASELRVEPDDVLDLGDAGRLADLAQAIIRHENGQQPYSRDLVERAASMALGRSVQPASA